MKKNLIFFYFICANKSINQPQVVARLTTRMPGELTQRSNELPAKGKKKQFYIESCLGGKIATVAVAASYILDIISALVVTNFVTKLHPELGWMDWQRMSGEGEQHEPLAQDCLKRGWLIHK